MVCSFNILIQGAKVSLCKDQKDHDLNALAFLFKAPEKGLYNGTSGLLKFLLT